MDVADFDFALPEGQIAQEPPVTRGGSRLLVLHRQSGAIDHTTFASLGEYLSAGDLVVLNNTKVFPARLVGRRVPSGGVVECLLLHQRATPDRISPAEEPRSPGPGVETATGTPRREAVSVQGAEVGGSGSQVWQCLMHPGQKLRPGARVVFEGQGLKLWGEVLARHFHGRRTIRLWSDSSVDVTATIDRIGHVPLPPYIARVDRLSDRERYQTVYARARGSVAAPTAGMHVTQELLERLEAKGVGRAEITLHVGYGTFKPVRVERVEDHTIEPEHFQVSEAAAEALTSALREGRRIVAVGTTTARTLESLVVSPGGLVRPTTGETDLFIYPGQEFRLVASLVTNFHLPRSSLLMLVAAFGGREKVLTAYREAVTHGYRFYSYGDAMLII